MENPQNQVAQSILSANNLLVTVSNNPSVDQLSAAIGLALLLNKMGKHATAVFSGQVPSTIEFLEPEKTLEKNTDSLRDFIIALDKSKADKLRYKVEDKLVKIFITPYRTSIDESDLEFSQGDFNVDAVIALGVKQKEQLDQAITSHGRILHDAVVISVNTDSSGELGSQNWVDTSASSLCEMVVSLIDLMKKDKELLDSQTATAFLTGIVAETQRFSNAKTNARTMTISSELMAAGANQQLVATKLEPTPLIGKTDIFDPSKLDELIEETKDTGTSSDGAMKINHSDEPKENDNHEDKDFHFQDSGMHSIDRGEPLLPEQKDEKPEEKNEDSQNFKNISQNTENANETKGDSDDFFPYLTEKPSQSSEPTNPLDGPKDIFADSDLPSLPPPNTNGPMLSHRYEPKDEKTDFNHTTVATLAPASRPIERTVRETKTLSRSENPDTNIRPSESVNIKEDDDKTLTELERYINSPHVGQQSQPASYAEYEQQQNTFGTQVNSARNAVDKAMGISAEEPLEPIAALNANPVNLDLGHGNTELPPVDNPLPQVSVNTTTGIPKFDMPGSQPPIVDTATQSQVVTQLQPNNQPQTPFVSPPAVPPPMMPPSFTPTQSPPQNQNPLVPPVL